MPKILHRKKLRKYCWRRFNIIVYLPRLGFKSRPFDFIPAFRYTGDQQQLQNIYLPTKNNTVHSVAVNIAKMCFHFRRAVVCR